MTDWISDATVVEFATGLVAGWVLLAALAGARVVRLALLLLAAGLIGLTLYQTGVEGLVTEARHIVAYTLAHATFFKGAAVGKLLATLLHVRSCPRRRR